MRPWLRLFWIAAITVSAPIDAASSPPNAALSTTPPCLRVCPQGDLVTTVIVRDITNNPIPNSDVVIDFSQCPGLVLCPSDGAEGYTISPGPRLSRLTDGAGQTIFRIRAAGVCQGSPTIVAGPGVILRQYIGVASPDQNGSLVVDNADDAILVTKLGGADVTGDLDCDGSVAPGDEAVLQAHLGHTCPIAVPALPRSWGRLKLIYR